MQTKRAKKIPDASHPITIEPTPGRVIVVLNGDTVADTRRAFTLREADYPPVQYIPRKDVNMSLLTRTNHATYCPYKGDASYYSISTGRPRSENGVWTYEAPYEPVSEIKDHLAFYSEAVDTIEVRDE